MGNRKCGTCGLHCYDRERDDWYCNNPSCDLYTYFTGYDDGLECDEYEERGSGESAGKTYRGKPDISYDGKALFFLKKRSQE